MSSEDRVQQLKDELAQLKDKFVQAKQATEAARQVQKTLVQRSREVELEFERNKRIEIEGQRSDEIQRARDEGKQLQEKILLFPEIEKDLQKQCDKIYIAKDRERELHKSLKGLKWHMADNPVSCGATCKVCMEKFKMEDKTPRLLECGHTFCEDCLNKMIEGGGERFGRIRCPQCRRLCRVENWQTWKLTLNLALL
ncbi:unnamed protein product [Caenorhabditis sp. 36 PRJEB53466]|nr:unnamed protein product [Caenorhabditis sp. 36 PRJEB53466]